MGNRDDPGKAIVEHTQRDAVGTEHDRQLRRASRRRGDEVAMLEHRNLQSEQQARTVTARSLWRVRCLQRLFGHSISHC